MMDAAVVVLKDWWRATHRPDLPQYHYAVSEAERDVVYPPRDHNTANAVNKVGYNVYEHPWSISYQKSDNKIINTATIISI
jgi:hypothetical protein